MYGHDTATTERINAGNVDAAFQYQPWNEEQQAAGGRESNQDSRDFQQRHVPPGFSMSPIRAPLLQAILEFSIGTLLLCGGFFTAGVLRYIERGFLMALIGVVLVLHSVAILSNRALEWRQDGPPHANAAITFNGQF